MRVDPPDYGGNHSILDHSPSTDFLLTGEISFLHFMITLISFLHFMFTMISLLGFHPYISYYDAIPIFHVYMDFILNFISRM